MEAGVRINTPRFCTVTIKEIFDNEELAFQAGYKEPTYYEDPSYGVVGKSLDEYHMEFAAFKKFCDNFKVVVKIGEKRYMFYGNLIVRNTTDAAGDPILFAPCWDMSNDKKGVINLNPDWTVKSVYC